MESADIRYLPKILFSQNSLARKASPARFAQISYKNTFYNEVCLLYTNWDFLEIQGDLLNRFCHYPCNFESFLNEF